MVHQVFLCPSSEQGGPGVVLVCDNDKSKRTVTLLKLDKGEQMEVSYARHSVASIFGRDPREILVGPLPNIKDPIFWHGRNMIVQHLTAGVGAPFRMELLGDGAEHCIVSAIEWATHAKAAREIDSSASSGSTSDDMAEPVAISTSDQLAVNFVRGLEPPQLRDSTLLTVLHMICACSLVSDSIAPILADAGFDIARLDDVPRSEILLPLASKALQVVLDRLARESHTIIESAAGASAAERIALLADVLGKADADASEAPRSVDWQPLRSAVERRTL